MEDLIYAFQDAVGNAIAGMSVAAVIILSIVAIIISLLLVYLFRIHIAYRMAKNRHRDPVGWALLSFFVSPIMTWLILLIIGNAKD